ncbi:MAG TPA: S9 family peptidase [Thermoanaerobaculia bacterium]
MKTFVILTLLAIAPAVPADELERSVAMMAKVGSAGSPSFSPDGKRLAFITNMSGSPQAWIISSEGGWPDQITAFDDPVTGIAWSPDGEWIALQVAPGGGLNSQIYVARQDGTALRLLTEGTRANNWLGLWMPDSKGLLVASNRRDGGSMDTWRLGLDASWTLIAENPGIGSAAAVSKDGRYILVSRLRNRGDNDVYRVAADGSGEMLLTKHNPPATTFGAEFGSDTNTIYLGGNIDRDLHAFGRVVVRDGKAGSFEVLAMRDDAELSGFLLNEQKTLAVLNWNVAGRSELTFYELAANRHRNEKLELPSDLAGLGEFSKDGTKLALTVSGSNAPADLWILQMPAGKFQQITRSPHPGVELSSLVRPELVRYKAHDDLELSGWLYRPAGSKPPYPVVFSFHGGPEAQERPYFNVTAQALVANGIAVFAPNVRGSSGFGKRFVNLDNGALRVNGVKDIESSVNHLVKSGIAAPKRLGIMGGSYGGYMVMAGVTEYPDMFAAGANLFGVVNFETFFKHSEPWMAAVSTIEYGNPATEAEMLRSLSPIHKIDRVKTPLIVLHGANDTNVPVIEAEQVVDSLRKREVPVEYILFPDEGHGWRKTPNRIRSTVSIVKFFKERL